MLSSDGTRPKPAATRSIRAIAVPLAAALLLGGCSDDSPESPDPQVGDPEITLVEYWGYQIQSLSEPGAVDALVNSRYDMLVLEPTRTDWSSDDKYFDTESMVERLKATTGNDGSRRKLVIAYIDIGEAEDWRWYWTWSQVDWLPGEDRPADWPEFIVTQDPDGWGGNYPVAYWDEDWKDIVIHGRNTGQHPDRNYASVLDEVLVDGFDGIYLDWVEAFSDEDVAAEAASQGKDPAVEMIEFIEEMRDYAVGRNPDLLIIQQNAADLSEGHPELFGAIDAIAQEAIWFDGDATDDWTDPGGYDFQNDASLTQWYLDALDPYLAAGLVVFNCEYALSHAVEAYALSYDNDFVPYCSRRPLSALTTTPPPGY
jgi:cysteinyl-tRNA synthetase